MVSNGHLFGHGDVIPADAVDDLLKEVVVVVEDFSDRLWVGDDSTDLMMQRGSINHTTTALC